MMLNFKSLYIEGFGSLLGPFTFDMEGHGITIIRGKNGAGKTSKLSALSWCCYGKTLKDKSSVEPWDHIQNKNYQGTKVQVNLLKGDDEIEIIRCNNYKGKVEGSKGGNRIILKLNGDVQKQYRNKGDTQKAIVDILGLSFELFRNSILFGQKMKRIIEESGPKQKEVFDEAFEVSYINAAKDNANKDYKTKKDDLTAAQHMVDVLSGKIESEKELYKQSKESYNNFKELKDKELKQLELDKADYEDGFSDHKNKKKGFEKKLAKLSSKKPKYDKDAHYNAEVALIEANDKLKEVKRQIENNKKEIKLQKDNKRNIPLNCNTCGATLDAKKIKATKATIQKALDDAYQNETDLELDLTFANKKVEELTKAVNKHEKAELKAVKFKEKVKGLKNSIDNAKSFAKSYLDNIQKVQSKITNVKSRKLPNKPSKSKIKKLRKEVKPHKEAVRVLSDEIELLTWLIKDPLSNSGLKNFIFNSMLDDVNHILYSYSSTLGFEVEFGIDIETSRKDFYSLISKDGNIIQFNDLSGGQQQLVNIAIAFAIHELVNKSHPINVLYLDEVFESLDEHNIEIVTELIQQKAQSKSIYLITHNPSFNPPNAKEIFLKLSKKGETKIV